MRSSSSGGEQVPGFRQRRGEALFLPERLLEALAKEEQAQARCECDAKVCRRLLGQQEQSARDQQTTGCVGNTVNTSPSAAGGMGGDARRTQADSEQPELSFLHGPSLSPVSAALVRR